jgi:hypothetical protein
MWKVKRMNTACIVVLAIANGAGGTAVRPACGFDGEPHPAGLALRFSATDEIIPGIPVNRTQR